MTTLRLTSNQNCLLKCSYCSVQHSAGWADELSRYGEYPVIFSMPIVAKTNADNFWDTWAAEYTKLTHIVIDSGEPITSEHTAKILNYVANFPNPELTIEIVSSFAVPSKDFGEYITQVSELVHKRRIKKFIQTVSIDSGKSDQAEYIRYGMHAAMFYHYVIRFLSATNDLAQLNFKILANNLSISGIRPLLEWVIDLRADYGQDNDRIKFDLQMLQYPAYQSAQIAPAWLVDHAERVAIWAESNTEFLTGPAPHFSETELDQIYNLVDWMKAGQQLDSEYVKKQQADFFRFFHEHDLRRKTSFLKTFPELKDWWQECQYHAENGY